MLSQYATLSSHALSEGQTGFHQPMQLMPGKVDLDTPAAAVMTDLKQVMAIIILDSKSLEVARQRMVKHGVRMLVVIDELSSVVGLITATDVMGEKPLQLVQETRRKREDILVRDIMTPREKLEVLWMEDVAAAKVGNVVSTLKGSGRQHALVVDGVGEHRKVRGIFSLTQIARQLGVEIHPNETARTFAEIQAQLG